MAKILAVGDLHLPATHPGYLTFCQDLYYQWDCDAVVMIGDLVDWGAISFHPQNPEIPGVLDEYELAYEQVHKWHKAFPKMKICIGNHDSRPVRLAASVNIPARLVRTYQETWATPGWEWGEDWIIDDVFYYHGTGQGGVYPAANAVRKTLMSTVLGHVHSACGIKWFASPHRRVFGLDVGCGIDAQAWQFAYGRHMKQRPILAAGIVLDGVGGVYSEIMPCSKGEPYHRSKFKTKQGKVR